MLTDASKATRNWLEGYYKLVDSKMLDQVVNYFANDARLTFANGVPVIGRAAIRAALGGLLDSVAEIHHEIRNLWEGSYGLVVFEVDVTYMRMDGRKLSVPSALFCHVNNELFSEQRIYLDLGPVYG